MKKTYTKTQIREAIAYWKGQLAKLDEARDLDSVAQNVLPPKVQAGMAKISGVIYQFVKGVAEEFPEDFDVAWQQNRAREIIDYLKKQ